MMITSCFAKKNTKCETMSQMMIRMEDNMEDRKVYCNNCPAFAPPTIPPTKFICGITGWELNRDGMYNFQQDYADCPLKRIELKDGTTYEPEIVGD
jgi:hypothetical protein